MSDDDRIINAVKGTKRACSHPWRHTTYGAGEKNGTVCMLCGEKIKATGWRKSQ
ncbi:MAG: hypothetical protein BWY85_00615 [Firmicutes bacterium ADurb.Bin506]|nr:MAG: hypothetical protein BWY85_00615 [Firmicutes bacterium ADurb.Bin506]